MNATRRKAIENILQEIKEKASELEQYRDEEQEAFDNMPENMQYGERGEKMEEHISNIEECMESINDACDELSDLLNDH